MANNDTIKVASRKDAAEMHLIFPETLAEKRYVAMTFYSSKIVKIDAAIAESTSAGNLSIGEFFTEISTKVKTELPKVAIKGANIVEDAFKKFIDSKGDSVVDNAKKVLNSTKVKDVNNALTSSSAVTGKDFEFGIYLPLTNQLRETMSQNYDPSDGLVSGKLSSLMDTINKTTHVSVQQLGNHFGSRTLLINPDMVQNYKGPGLRELTLNWSLLPNNRKEALNIFKIIKQLKMAASPSISKDVKAIMYSPMFCSVTFENVDLDEMVRFDEMVISNIAVNYSESGFMETFKDGIPKAVNLSLTLLERRMKTSSDWSNEKRTKKEFSDVGVGLANK